MAEYTENIEASSADVYTLAGHETDVNIANDAIAQANHIIETISGVFLLAEDRTTPISKRDAVWLRKAITFQAAWIIEHPDVFSRMAVSSLSQEGLSMSAANDLSFVLSPLAKRALQNCTWTKNGTLKVEAANLKLPVDILTSDDHEWSPLAGA